MPRGCDRGWTWLFSDQADCRKLDDPTLGQRFTGTTWIRIEGMAAEFDPQPFHLDESAASASIFRGLAANGWHTAAVTMRLLVDSEFKPAGGIVGAVSMNCAGPCLWVVTRQGISSLDLPEKIVIAVASTTT